MSSSLVGNTKGRTRGRRNSSIGGGDLDASLSQSLNKSLTFGSPHRSKSKSGTSHFGNVKGFHVYISGQIASAQLSGVKNPVCKYQMVSGSDWDCVKGFIDGESQVSRNVVTSSTEPSVVWNFPLNVTYKTTNVSGWPRLVVSVRDAGRVIHGYGTTSVPTIPGKHVRYVQLFTPVSASWIQAFISLFTGEPPDFYDARFTTANDGRYAARVKSAGVAKVEFSVYVTGAGSLGYDFGEPDPSSVEEFRPPPHPVS